MWSWSFAKALARLRAKRLALVRRGTELHQRGIMREIDRISNREQNFPWICAALTDDRWVAHELTADVKAALSDCRHVAMLG